MVDKVYWFIGRRPRPSNRNFHSSKIMTLRVSPGEPIFMSCDEWLINFPWSKCVKVSMGFFINISLQFICAHVANYAVIPSKDFQMPIECTCGINTWKLDVSKLDIAVADYTIIQSWFISAFSFPQMSFLIWSDPWVRSLTGQSAIQVKEYCRLSKFKYDSSRNSHIIEE